MTWNYLLQGHCPLPYVRNKFRKQNISGMQYHQFLIIEFQPNRLHNMEVIIASQAKHIHHKKKGLELQSQVPHTWQYHQF